MSDPDAADFEAIAKQASELVLRTNVSEDLAATQSAAVRGMAAIARTMPGASLPDVCAAIGEYTAGAAGARRARLVLARRSDDGGAEALAFVASSDPSAPVAALRGKVPLKSGAWQLLESGMVFVAHDRSASGRFLAETALGAFGGGDPSRDWTSTAAAASSAAASWSEVPSSLLAVRCATPDGRVIGWLELHERLTSRGGGWSGLEAGQKEEEEEEEEEMVGEWMIGERRLVPGGRFRRADQQTAAVLASFVAGVVSERVRGWYAERSSAVLRVMLSRARSRLVHDLQQTAAAEAVARALASDATWPVRAAQPGGMDAEGHEKGAAFAAGPALLRAMRAVARAAHSGAHLVRTEKRDRIEAGHRAAAVIDTGGTSTFWSSDTAGFSLTPDDHPLRKSATFSDKPLKISNEEPENGLLELEEREDDRTGLLSARLFLWGPLPWGETAEHEVRSGDGVSGVLRCLVEDKVRQLWVEGRERIARWEDAKARTAAGEARRNVKRAQVQTTGADTVRVRLEDGEEVVEDDEEGNGGRFLPSQGVVYDAARPWLWEEPSVAVWAVAEAEDEDEVDRDDRDQKIRSKSKSRSMQDVDVSRTCEGHVIVAGAPTGTDARLQVREIRARRGQRWEGEDEGIRKALGFIRSLRTKSGGVVAEEDAELVSKALGISSSSSVRDQIVLVAVPCGFVAVWGRDPPTDVVRYLCKAAEAMLTSVTTSLRFAEFLGQAASQAREQRKRVVRALSAGAKVRHGVSHPHDGARRDSLAIAALSLQNESETGAETSSDPLEQLALALDAALDAAGDRARELLGCTVATASLVEPREQRVEGEVTFETASAHRRRRPPRAARVRDHPGAYFSLLAGDFPPLPALAVHALRDPGTVVHAKHSEEALHHEDESNGGASTADLEFDGARHTKRREPSELVEELDALGDSVDEPAPLVGFSVALHLDAVEAAYLLDAFGEEEGAEHDAAHESGFGGTGRHETEEHHEPKSAVTTSVSRPRRGSVVMEAVASAFASSRHVLPGAGTAGSSARALAVVLTLALPEDDQKRTTGRAFVAGEDEAQALLPRLAAASLRDVSLRVSGYAAAELRPSALASEALPLVASAPDEQELVLRALSAVRVAAGVPMAEIFLLDGDVLRPTGAAALRRRPALSNNQEDLEEEAQTLRSEDDLLQKEFELPPTDQDLWIPISIANTQNPVALCAERGEPIYLETRQGAADQGLSFVGPPPPEEEVKAAAESGAALDGASGIVVPLVDPESRRTLGCVIACRPGRVAAELFPALNAGSSRAFAPTKGHERALELIGRALVAQLDAFRKRDDEIAQARADALEEAAEMVAQAEEERAATEEAAMQAATVDFDSDEKHQHEDTQTSRAIRALIRARRVIEAAMGGPDGVPPSLRKEMDELGAVYKSPSSSSAKQDSEADDSIRLSTSKSMRNVHDQLLQRADGARSTPGVGPLEEVWQWDGEVRPSSPKAPLISSPSYLSLLASARGESPKTPRRPSSFHRSSSRPPADASFSFGAEEREEQRDSLLSDDVENAEYVDTDRAGAMETPPKPSTPRVPPTQSSEKAPPTQPTRAPVPPAAPATDPSGTPSQLVTFSADHQRETPQSSGGFEAEEEDKMKEREEAVRRRRMAMRLARSGRGGWDGSDAGSVASEWEEDGEDRNSVLEASRVEQSGAYGEAAAETLMGSGGSGCAIWLRRTDEVVVVGSAGELAGATLRSFPPGHSDGRSGECLSSGRVQFGVATNGAFWDALPGVADDRPRVWAPVGNAGEGIVVVVGPKGWDAEDGVAAAATAARRVRTSEAARRRAARLEKHHEKYATKVQEALEALPREWSIGTPPDEVAASCNVRSALERRLFGHWAASIAAAPDQDTLRRGVESRGPTLLRALQLGNSKWTLRDRSNPSDLLQRASKRPSWAQKDDALLDRTERNLVHGFARIVAVPLRLPGAASPRGYLLVATNRALPLSERKSSSPDRARRSPVNEDSSPKSAIRRPGSRRRINSRVRLVVADGAAPAPKEAESDQEHDKHSPEKPATNDEDSEDGMAHDDFVATVSVAASVLAARLEFEGARDRERAALEERIRELRESAEKVRAQFQMLEDEAKEASMEIEKAAEGSRLALATLGDSAGKVLGSVRRKSDLNDVAGVWDLSVSEKEEDGTWTLPIGTGVGVRVAGPKLDASLSQLAGIALWVRAAALTAEQRESDATTSGADRAVKDVATQAFQEAVRQLEEAQSAPLATSSFLHAIRAAVRLQLGSDAAACIADLYVPGVIADRAGSRKAALPWQVVGETSAVVGPSSSSSWALVDPNGTPVRSIESFRPHRPRGDVLAVIGRGGLGLHDSSTETVHRIAKKAGHVARNCAKAAESAARAALQASLEERKAQAAESVRTDGSVHRARKLLGPQQSAAEAAVQAALVAASAPVLDDDALYIPVVASLATLLGVDGGESGAVQDHETNEKRPVSPAPSSPSSGDVPPETGFAGLMAGKQVAVVGVVVVRGLATLPATATRSKEAVEAGHAFTQKLARLALGVEHSIIPWTPHGEDGPILALGLTASLLAIADAQHVSPPSHSSGLPLPSALLPPSSSWLVRGPTRAAASAMADLSSISDVGSVSTAGGSTHPARWALRQSALWGAALTHYLGGSRPHRSRAPHPVRDGLAVRLWIGTRHGWVAAGTVDAASRKWTLLREPDESMVGRAASTRTASAIFEHGTTLTVAIPVFAPPDDAHAALEESESILAATTKKQPSSSSSSHVVAVLSIHAVWPEAPSTKTTKSRTPSGTSAPKTKSTTRSTTPTSRRQSPLRHRPRSVSPMRRGRAGPAVVELREALDSVSDGAAEVLARACGAIVAACSAGRAANSAARHRRHLERTREALASAGTMAAQLERANGRVREAEEQRVQLQEEVEKLQAEMGVNPEALRLVTRGASPDEVLGFVMERFTAESALVLGAAERPEPTDAELEESVLDHRSTSSNGGSSAASPPNKSRSKDPSSLRVREMLVAAATSASDGVGQTAWETLSPAELAAVRECVRTNSVVSVASVEELDSRPIRQNQSDISAPDVRRDLAEELDRGADTTTADLSAVVQPALLVVPVPPGPPLGRGRNTTSGGVLVVRRARPFETADENGATGVARAMSCALAFRAARKLWDDLVRGVASAASSATDTVRQRAMEADAARQALHEAESIAEDANRRAKLAEERAQRAIARAREAERQRDAARDAELDATAKAASLEETRIASLASVAGSEVRSRLSEALARKETAERAREHAEKELKRLRKERDEARADAKEQKAQKKEARRQADALQNRVDTLEQQLHQAQRALDKAVARRQAAEAIANAANVEARTARSDAENANANAAEAYRQRDLLQARLDTLSRRMKHVVQSPEI